MVYIHMQSSSTATKGDTKKAKKILVPRPPKAAKTPQPAPKTPNVPDADSDAVDRDGTSSLNPVTHIFGVDQQQVLQRLTKYKPLDNVFHSPTNDSAKPSKPEKVSPHFDVLNGKQLERQETLKTHPVHLCLLTWDASQEWKSRLPRFLFRGFHSESGGNPALNRSRLIQPHAFYGTHKNVEPWPWDQGGKPVTSLSLKKLKNDVDGHLSGDWVTTHFSSWAADFSTAISYARQNKSSMIAVLDTSLCGTHTAVYHVPAFEAAGVCASYGFAEEYLVYGPVVGAAYCCCVPVPSLLAEGFQLYNYSDPLTGSVTAGDLGRASRVASLFRHENYKAAGPALFLTVFAAELSRLKRPHRSHESAVAAWSLNDIASILQYLEPEIYDAALFHFEPLVNPETYVHTFRQLQCMVDLLVAVEAEIRKRRQEWLAMTRRDRVEPPSRAPGPEASEPRAGKRKADGPAGSSRPSKKAGAPDEDESGGRGPSPPEHARVLERGSSRPSPSSVPEKKRARRRRAPKH